MWVARDRDGELYFYPDKPVKESSVWGYGTDFVEIDANLFPEVKWEDEEPTEVDIVIKETRSS